MTKPMIPFHESVRRVRDRVSVAEIQDFLPSTNIVFGMKSALSALIAGVSTAENRGRTSEVSGQKEMARGRAFRLFFSR